MKFSDFRGGDAIDLIADLLDPISNIAADMEFRGVISKADKMAIAKYLLEKHKGDILEILARMSGTTVEQYNANAIEMLKQVMEIINDKEFVQFFQSQGLMATDGSFGSATESIGETETT